MRNFVLSVIMVASAAVFCGTAQADTVEVVDQYWAARGHSGEALENVRASIDIATRLAVKADNVVEQARLYNKASEAALWVGGHVETKAEKIKVYEKGFTLAQAAIDLLADKADLAGEDKRVLATAYVNYTSNRGRWGRTRGVMKSLAHAPEVLRRSRKVIEMGFEDIFDYAPHRTIGRVNYRLGVLGKKKDAYDHLKIAFDSTQYKDLGISRHGSNNVFYADALNKYKKDTTEACRILKTFLAQKPADLNPDRIPETEDERKDAQDSMAKYCTQE